jgi:uncharacterized membrane protein
MSTERLTAFSDGVIAIIITIMVLELKVPHGDDWTALAQLTPVFLSYVLSFVYVGIHWNNHHHLMHTCKAVDGGIMWANLHLLFWLSLIPFATAWMGDNHFASLPTAVYGVTLLMPAFAWQILQWAIIRNDGRDGTLARALGTDWKGHISPLIYAIAIGLAFVAPWMSHLLYISVALIWLIPDRRIERHLAG